MFKIFFIHVIDYKEIYEISVLISLIVIIKHSGHQKLSHTLHYS